MKTRLNLPPSAQPVNFEVKFEKKICGQFLANFGQKIQRENTNVPQKLFYS